MITMEDKQSKNLNQTGRSRSDIIESKTVYMEDTPQTHMIQGGITIYIGNVVNIKGKIIDAIKEKIQSRNLSQTKIPINRIIINHYLSS